MLEVRDKLSRWFILNVPQAIPPNIQLVSTERAITGNISNRLTEAGLRLSVWAADGITDNRVTIVMANKKNNFNYSWFMITI